MVQINSYTLTQYVMIIYVITTSVYADLKGSIIVNVITQKFQNLY